MSTSRAPFSAGRTDRQDAGPPWSTVGVRMFLAVLPSLLIGFVLSTLLLPATVLVANPDLGWLLNLPPGLLAGLALGLVLSPSRGRLVPYLVVAAGLTAVVVLALLALAQLRVPGSASGLDVSSLVLGLLVTVVAESTVAGALWWWKGRGPR
jgi:hypothetical protein